MIKPVTIRAVTLLACCLVFALVPAWRRPGFPPPAPQGFGVAKAPNLGGERELDALGKIWYFDYNYSGPTQSKHPRFLLVGSQDDLRELRDAARTHPGAWWQFGNEPNDPNQDNVAPELYARLYHRFYFALKGFDPSARVATAGIANADWKWADAFRQAYRGEFGREPPVDGWNIHNYLLDTCRGALDVETFKTRVFAFREWMARAGQDRKPLFLTEYGVLYGNGCCGCPIIPGEEVVNFMRVTTRWLRDSSMITAWAWFAVDTHNQFNGDLFEDDARLTIFGATYRKLIADAARSP